MQARVAARPVASPFAPRAAASALLAVAAGSIVLPRLPREWTGMAQAEDAAGFLAVYASLLAAGLLQKSEPARRFVVLASVVGLPFCLLLAFAPLPGGRLFAAMWGSLLLGLFGLLFRPPASTARGAAFAVVAGAGALAFVPAQILLARAPLEQARREFAEWTLPQSRFEDATRGVRLELPPGWSMMKPGSPYLPPADRVLLLAHRDSTARATLHVEERVQGVAGASPYLGMVIEDWRSRQRDLEAGQATAVKVGTVDALRLEVSWAVEETSFSGRVIVWRDQSRFFTWTAWAEAEDLEGLAALDPLGQKLVATETLGAALTSALAAASTELPQFSRSTIEALLRYRPALVQSPPEATFREALYAASRGFSSVRSAEVRELGQLNGLLYEQVPEADRQRLLTYSERLRSLMTVAPAEDAWAMRTTREAFLRLPEDAQERFRRAMDQLVLATVPR